MALRFAVPKFITIEDRLAGLFTFRQLFALLGAFLLTFFVFRINPLIGIILGIILFILAFVLTFIYINGKPMVFIIPSILDFFIKGGKYTWKRIERIGYKEIEIPESEEPAIEVPLIKKRERKISSEEVPIEIKYPEVAPKFRERVVISLRKPLSEQVEKLNKLIHRHLINPKNPYRFFPYIKFYRAIK